MSLHHLFLKLDHIEVGSYKRIYAGGANTSTYLAEYYQKKAIKLDCDFFDAGAVVTSCQIEGIHWPKKQHTPFAKAIYTKIISMYI